MLRTASLRRTDDRAHDDGETFVMPPETEDTREDTAYAASESRDTTPTERGEAQGERRQQRTRSNAPTSARGERAQGGQSAEADAPDAHATPARGVERMATGVVSDAVTENVGRSFFTEEAMTLAREAQGGEQTDAKLERGSATLERLSEAAREALSEAQGAQDGEGEEAMERLDAARLESRERSQGNRELERKVGATTAFGRRVVSEQTDQDAVELGDASESDALMVEEAASEAFDKAQASRAQGAALSRQALSGSQRVCLWSTGRQRTDASAFGRHGRSRVHGLDHCDADPHGGDHGRTTWRRWR